MNNDNRYHENTNYEQLYEIIKYHSYPKIVLATATPITKIDTNYLLTLLDNKILENQIHD